MRIQTENAGFFNGLLNAKNGINRNLKRVRYSGAAGEEFIEFVKLIKKGSTCRIRRARLHSRFRLCGRGLNRNLRIQGRNATAMERASNPKSQIPKWAGHRPAHLGFSLVVEEDR
jgi:hypothetical protein